MGLSDVMMGQVNTIFQHKKPLEHFSEATYTVYSVLYCTSPIFASLGIGCAQLTFSSGTRLYVLFMYPFSVPKWIAEKVKETLGKLLCS
jgi:hypothetical protein